MILRILTLAGGLAGAAGVSQFPEYSQQYLQRLGGAVDELSRVVADFDASAAAEGLSREAALAQMVGTDFVERRRADMERTIDRHDRLSADLAALRGTSPFQRAVQPQRFTDRELAQRAWDDFKPAVPVTVEGLSFAGIGFLGGALILSGLIRLLRLPFRRRRPAPEGGATG